MRHEDIPEINNPKIRFPVLEGDKLMKEVLNGGYNVHPVPPPNSEIKERITKRYERERIKIEKLFTLGYTTSGDPFWTRTRWNLSEEDKDMIVNEISLVIQKTPECWNLKVIIQKTLGGDVGQDTEYKFYIKEVVLERKRSPPDVIDR